MPLPNIGTFLVTAKYKIIAGVAAIALIAGGGFAVYEIGLHKGMNQSAVAIASYEGKIQKLNADLEAKSGKVTEKVLTEYKDRVVEHTQVVYKNHDVIHTVVPSQYTLSQGWVYSHNQSAAGAVIDASKASNATPSQTTDRSGLEQVTDNYGICHANADKLTALQSWVKQQEELRDASK
jgi:hypothetical protein